MQNWLHILIVNLSPSQTQTVGRPVCKTIRDVTWKFKSDLTSRKICHHQSDWWWLVGYYFVTPLEPAVTEAPTNYNCRVRPADSKQSLPALTADICLVISLRCGGARCEPGDGQAGTESPPPPPVTTVWPARSLVCPTLRPGLRQQTIS